MTALLNKVLAKLDGVHGSDPQWTALCPAHEDAKPSLSITEGDGGRVLLHCHAGCKTEDVVAALELEMSDLFPPEGQTTQCSTPKPARSELPPISDDEVLRLHQALTDAHRDYLRQQRMLTDDVIDCYQLGLVERNGQPRFTIPVRDDAGQVADIRLWLQPEQRNADASKMLAWEKGRGRARLFPLDQFEAPSLVLVEGELDALALIGQGQATITNTNGVKAWSHLDHEFPRFKGKQITILMDNDSAGEKGAIDCANSLAHYEAEVRIAHWPEGRDDGWDVTDELREHGADSLRQIIAAAEMFEGAPDGDSDDNDGSDGEKSKDSQANKLLNIALEESELFHDDTDTPFAWVQIGTHREVMACSSKSFQRHLVRRFYEEHQAVPGGEAVKNALQLIEAEACFRGEQHQLHNRVARHGDSLWYDLTNDSGQAVQITSAGWTIAEPPILFIRHSHQAAQVEPVRGGDINRFFEFVSIDDERKGDRLLMLVWLVASFIPGFPHPIPVLHGPQGSGKSSTFRTLRRLIDPSAVETLTFPRGLSELIQILSHHWAPLFDNVGGLSPGVSDALCRATTGEGFSKRRLYSDDEDFIYRFQRVIGLNGINVVATRADLLDRAILIGLDRIEPEARRTEQALEKAFEEARPQILGGILDTLVKALAIEPDLELESLPRMADFCRWGCAITRALGYTDEDFLAAYEGNIQRQNNEVLESHPVAVAVMHFMSGRTVWEGEPSELHRQLEDEAEESRIDTRDKDWPKAANRLTRRLNEIKPNLLAAGIEVTGGRGKRRHIHIEKIGKQPSLPTQSSPISKNNNLEADDSASVAAVGQSTDALSSSPNFNKNSAGVGSDDSDGSVQTSKGESPDREQVVF